MRSLIKKIVLNIYTQRMSIFWTSGLHNKVGSFCQNIQWVETSMLVKCGCIINTVRIKISCIVITNFANPSVIRLLYNLTHQVKFFTTVVISSHCNLHVHLTEQPSERQFTPHRWFLTCWITHHYTNLFSNNWTRRWSFQGHLSLWMNKFS